MSNGITEQQRSHLARLKSGVGKVVDKVTGAARPELRNMTEAANYIAASNMGDDQARQLLHKFTTFGGLAFDQLVDEQIKQLDAQIASIRQTAKADAERMALGIASNKAALAANDARMAADKALRRDQGLAAIRRERAQLQKQRRAIDAQLANLDGKEKQLG